MTRITTLGDEPTELEQVWGLRADYFHIFIDDYLRSLRRLDPVLVELCRMRIAQLVESDFDQALRYQPAIEAGLTEAKLTEVTDYPTSPLYTPRERAVLEFAEQFVIQSSSISDEDCARLQEHLSAEEFIYLTKSLSVMDQFARANSAFRIAPSAVAPSIMTDFTVVADAAA